MKPLVHGRKHLYINHMAFIPCSDSENELTGELITDFIRRMRAPPSRVLFSDRASIAFSMTPSYSSSVDGERNPAKSNA